VRTDFEAARDQGANMRPPTDSDISMNAPKVLAAKVENCFFIAAAIVPGKSCR
jgi:hypothetical protein